MIKNETFWQGEGVAGDEGAIDVTVGTQGAVLGFPNGDGDKSDWFYRCSDPAKVRYLGQVIIDASNALEDRQTEGNGD